MAYAPTGGLGLVVDHEGHGKWLVYDALGRRVKTFEPNSGEYTLRYDGFGDLTEEFTPNGDWFFYEYDRLGRKTSEAIAHVSPSGPGPLVPQANWVYDETFIGALTYEQGGTNGPSSYCRAFEYDSRGRVVQDVVHHDAGVLVTQKAYDAYVGRLKAVAFPDAVGTTVGLMYGPSGHFLGEFDPGTGDVYREITSRDARGQITSEIFGNGLVGEYDLSPSTSSTKQLVVRNPSTGDVFQHLEYEYDDPRTLLTKRHNLVHQVEERFGYDDLQRLEYAERTWVPFPLRPGGTERVDYEYNNVGNLTFKSDYAQIVEYGDVDRDGPSRAGPHAIRSYTDTNGVVIDDFEYDANGNLLVGDGRETAYDAYNKPTRIETNWSGSIADFRYGPNRELYRRSEGSEVTWMVGEYYERVDDGSGTVRHRLRIGDRVTMLVEAGTSETLYRHPDRLGSAALTTKSNGTVFERRGHGPFGNPRDGDWHDVGVLNSSVDEQGFIGHDHIDSARVVHMGGRVYDYRLGRFMSVDPFAEVADLQSHNSYSYVRNNSLNRVDPTGYIDVEDTPKEVEPDPDTIVIYDDGTARDTTGEVVFKLSGMDMARLNNQLTTSFGAKQNGLLLLTDIPDWPLPGGSRGGDGNANRGGQGSAGTSAKNGIEDTTMSMTTAELGGLTVAKAAEILIEKGIFKRRALRDLKDRTKVALARKGAGPTAPRKKFDSWEKAVDFVNTHEGWFHAGGLTVTNGKSKTMYIFMGATKSVETIHWKRGRKVLMTPRQSMLHTVHHEFLHWDGQPSHGADPLGRNFVRWNIRVRNELDSWLDDDF
ncbi:MAG: RHS repeat-associated core domain-containing protein [Myxococcota bacterium]